MKWRKGEGNREPLLCKLKANGEPARICTMLKTGFWVAGFRSNSPLGWLRELNFKPMLKP